MTGQDYEATMETPNHPRKENRAEQTTDQRPACTYVVVIPTTERPIIEALENLIKALSSQEPFVLPVSVGKPSLEIVDSWLEHSAAAEYLGVARSTLYRYAEHHEIESRKFCGRLQYRLSSLDEFQTRHVRPACAFHADHAIISSAPRSGKSEER